MPSHVLFKFGLGPKEPAISKRHDIWSTPLPVKRQAFHGNPDGGDVAADLTYGDYFTAARDFLIQKQCKWLRHAAGRLTGRVVGPSDIDEVAIYLLKHGAFYHPSQVVLTVLNQPLALVLNMAVSFDGQEVLPREYDCLAHLNENLTPTFWPAVFGQGRGSTHRGQVLPMFLGQWFSGFYEFHLTKERPPGELSVAVWDTDQGPHLLKDRSVLDLIRQAAVILSYAYNPLTFQAILDWHHGAGDFVVRTGEEAIELRLITVRNYAPLIQRPEPDVESVLDGLLLFLVSISFRLRLDRLDGIGRPAIYPEAVIPAICQGFWQGLKMAIESRSLPDDLIPAVQAFLSIHQAEQLVPLADAVLANFPSASEEGRLLRAATNGHLAVLARTIARPDMT